MNNNNSRGNASNRGGNDRKKPAGRSTGSGGDTRKPSGNKSEGFSKKTQGNDKPFRGKKSFVKRNDAPKAVKKPINPDEMRLNKYIANSGVCSRRDADIYIESGNVRVNGKVVTEMGHKVRLTDKVDFDGTVISPEKKEYILLNKPKNFTTSGDDERDMRNVMELVRNATKAKLQPVGRMDKNTTGLLIFTNDPDMLRKFSLPNQTSFKIYQVSLSKNLKFEDLEKMNNNAVTLDGHRLFIDEVSYIDNEAKTEVGIKLRTQNIGVIRSIFESFKYDVLKVDRVSYAGLTKKNLPRGNWRLLTEQEIINLNNV
ncbi:MAG: pseudouridylate synthase [Flavobacterium sp. MedPE-SWcel]|uniref:pseudouridine synthase n=1 Tax=uncultured Flavobacterium sp. TaxID=165435 RepID=UPI00091653E6|nr:pseudouridine synthase [uncultured Flavobacterium sp.]OIQ17610.1 MAG: pseudouridylate synthase [Flavobacterium sp. MedPE-SWcel]